MTQRRIGLIVPCDLILDSEYPRYLADSTTTHITRTGYHDGGLTKEFIMGVASPAEVSYAARSLTKIHPDVISFACTSGSFLHGLGGEMRLRDVIREAGAKVAQTTSGALLDAVAALRISSLGIATPYPEEVGDILAKFLEETGTTVLARHHTELHDVLDPITDTQVYDMVKKAVAGHPDAVFLACTGVPTFDLVSDLESEFGLPVLTANQVTMWAAAGAAGAGLSKPGHVLLSVEWEPR